MDQMKNLDAIRNYFSGRPDITEVENNNQFVLYIFCEKEIRLLNWYASRSGFVSSGKNKKLTVSQLFLDNSLYLSR